MSYLSKYQTGGKNSTRISTPDCPSSGNQKLKKFYGADYIDKCRNFGLADQELKSDGCIYFDYIEYNPVKKLENNFVYYRDSPTCKIGMRTGIQLKAIFKGIQNV